VHLRLFRVVQVHPGGQQGSVASACGWGNERRFDLSQNVTCFTMLLLLLYAGAPMTDGGAIRALIQEVKNEEVRLEPKCHMFYNAFASFVCR